MQRWNLIAVALLLVAPSALLAQENDDAMKHDKAMEHMDKMEHMDATADITAHSEAFEAAWNASDWAALAAMYMDDAIVMPPGSEAIEGMEAISAFFGALPGDVSLDLTTLEVFSVMGAALEVGSWVMTAADGSHADHGSYMAAFSKTDDGWKIARDIWNSNMAPAGY
jgi:uncharacterized protein (TIGR02246 family)